MTFMETGGCRNRRHVVKEIAALFFVIAAMFIASATATNALGSLSVENFDIGVSVIGIAFDGTYIWATGFFEDRLVKVQASDGTVVGSYGALDPLYVACDGVNVWVTSLGGDLTEFRGSDGTKVQTIDLGTSPLGGALFDGENIWVANPVGNSVQKVRASDGTLLGGYDAGKGAYQLAFDGANIWVTNRDEGTVSKLRASDGQLLFTVPAGPSPLGIVYDGREIWVANSYSGVGDPPRTITKLRLSDGAILRTARVGEQPQLLAFDGNDIWVSNYSPNNTVVRLRAHDGARVLTVMEGLDPEGILFDGTSIWIGYYVGGNLCKITP